jgi:hypothetical protein
VALRRRSSTRKSNGNPNSKSNPNNSNNKSKSKPNRQINSKFKSVGQECPTHTGNAISLLSEKYVGGDKYQEDNRDYAIHGEEGGVQF